MQLEAPRFTGMPAARSFPAPPRLTAAEAPCFRRKGKATTALPTSAGPCLSRHCFCNEGDGSR
eukprot:3478785-Alexandrium_andersonii.AAC.1